MEKNRTTYDVKDYSQEDYPHLSRMYDLFTPKAKFQGMPPVKKPVRERWLRQLIMRGWNILAWCGEGEVVGHAVLFPDLDVLDAEYLIFVSQSYRSLGVGKALTLSAIERARTFDLKTIWLTVDAYNFRAIRLYRKMGFRNLEGYDATTERMMTLAL
jgi:GNAT superfamily N-acetyltransferase